MTDAPPAAVPAHTRAADAHLGEPARPSALDATFAGAVTAIWLRELRGRMRGRRAFVFVTIYLAFLVAILWIVLRGTLEESTLSALQQVSVGRGIFTGVILIETLVVVALAPAYTAGSISTEREKQTFDLLAVTPVPSLAIVVGKLLSGLSYLVLLVALSIPLASLAFIFGGVGIETAALAYLVLLLTAVGVGCIGIACSAIMTRTQPATVGATMVVALAVIGASVTWLVLSERARFEGTAPPPEALLYLNPFLAQADVLCEGTGFACIPGVTVPQEPMVRFDVTMPIDEVGGAVQGQAPVVATTPVPGSFWPKASISWILLSIALIAFASQGISPTRRWRPSRKAATPTEPDR